MTVKSPGPAAGVGWPVRANPKLGPNPKPNPNPNPNPKVRGCFYSKVNRSCRLLVAKTVEHSVRDVGARVQSPTPTFL